MQRNDVRNAVQPMHNTAFSFSFLSLHSTNLLTMVKHPNEKPYWQCKARHLFLICILLSVASFAHLLHKHSTLALSLSSPADGRSLRPYGDYSNPPKSSKASTKRPMNVVSKKLEDVIKKEEQATPVATSSSTKDASSGVYINTDATVSSTVTENPKKNRCALCFFGLPRSYATMVLPSIEKYILKTNANYLCDIFVHYFHQTTEAAGRYNNGGEINPDEILKLQQSVEKFYKNFTVNSTIMSSTKPKLTLLFTNDTNETFYDQQSSNLHKYHTTLDRKGKQVYFPHRSNWVNVSLDNMIKQWHSINGVFDLMKGYAQTHNIEYTRVGMLRNDVVYLTPVDIMRIDNGTFDVNNEYFVLPNFAKYPISDRMIYGPYKAVEVWSKRRFDLVEERIKTQYDFGWKMHSERFMNSTIIPAIEALGYKKNLNRDICFFRSRTNEMLMASDCFMAGSVRGFVKNETNIRKVVETAVDRNCSDVIIDEQDTNIHFLYC